jgi:hypothetical protein
LPGQLSTYYWVKSKTIIEKHQNWEKVSLIKMHFLFVFNFTQFWLDGQPGNEYFLIPHKISGLLTPLAPLGVRLQWFERDLSHSFHSCMNSYKNYNTSNLLFIFQIIWFSTYAWFLFQACDVRGSANTTTTVDSYSGSLINETCKCKNFVKGEFCNECKEGYWNLTQINPNGCQSK